MARYEEACGDRAVACVVAAAGESPANKTHGLAQ